MRSSRSKGHGSPGHSIVSVARSIIIVNWNAGPALTACVDSVADEAARGQEVIVVDNASMDGSLDAATASRPWIRVVHHDTNLGFAAGANAGAAAAQGAVLVFLNPDAVVDPGAVARLAAEITTDHRTAIAGGGLNDLDGRWQAGAARFEPVTHLLFDTTLGRWWARRRRAAYEVDWVYGTFLAIRAEVFRTLGGFDVRFFCYGEDLDLCYRVRRTGDAVRHVPAARARHGHNISAVQRFGSGRDAEAVKGELRFYAWRWGAFAVQRYRVTALVKYRLKWAWQQLRRRPAEAAISAAVVTACREFRTTP